MGDPNIIIPDKVAAHLERQADELERWGRASRNLGFTDYAEGKADGIEVAVTHLRERASELRGDVQPQEIARQRAAGWPDFHPEDVCHRCGRRNPVWYADAEAWSIATQRRERGELDILCPPCFVLLYEQERPTPQGFLWHVSLVDFQTAEVRVGNGGAS